MSPTTIETSCWTDLVYHVFTGIPLRRDDASGLHDPAYAAWATARLPHAEVDTRTLPTDGTLLAQLLSGAPGAAALQAFPHLHESCDAFRATMGRRFSEIRWPSQRQAVADQISARVPTTVLELFRVAVWGELQAGFCDFWERTLAPLEQAAMPAMTMAWHEIAMALPTAARGQLLISYPLRRHGRLLRRWPSPLIAVGSPHTNHGAVLALESVIAQACHEFLLAAVLCALPARPPGDTIVDSDGFAAHAAPELLALSLGATCYRRHSLPRAWPDWIHALLPGGLADLRHFTAPLGMAPASESGLDMESYLCRLPGVPIALRQVRLAAEELLQSP